MPAPRSYFFRSRVECLLRKIPRLHCCVIARPRLLHPDHSVLHVHPDLIELLLEIQLVLPEFDYAGRVIGLGGAISKWNIQGKTGGVIREIAGENLFQHYSIAAGEAGHIADAAQSVIGQFRKDLQRRLQRILYAHEIQLVAVEVNPGLLYFESILQCVRDQVVDGRQVIVSGNRDDVQRNDVDVGEVGCCDSRAAQGVFQHRLLLQ